MPFIAEKFPTFHDFASASLIDIYTDEKLNEAEHFEINTLQSIYLKNNGNDQFEINPLPMEAQISVITDFVIKDIDYDGYEDVILVGNKYETEVETTRYDASKGLVLKGHGNGKFESVSSAKSGLSIDGNMRRAELIDINNQLVLLIAINNDKMAIRELNNIKNISTQ